MRGIDPPWFGSCERNGRIAGALFLAAFVLYGVGNALSDTWVGITLMLGNSLAVAAIGVLVHACLRTEFRHTSNVYLGARVVEAVTLGTGALLLSADHTEANAQLYRVGMLALGLGSIPFCRVLSRMGWAPRWLAWWGLVGYGILIAGAALDFVIEGALLVASIPGGFFEVMFAVHLIRRGFASRQQSARISPAT